MPGWEKKVNYFDVSTKGCNTLGVGSKIRT